jgi:hypothetical protein
VYRLALPLTYLTESVLTGMVGDWYMRFCIAKKAELSKRS